MTIDLQSVAKPGFWYLGAEVATANADEPARPLQYRSADLVTHGVCIGMTGSGKTGLCISLLEECALSGVPAILIDPKGDLTNLELAFPDLRAEDFRPWINEDEARRNGSSPEEFAAAEAGRWKEGLGQWGIEADRIRRYREQVDVRIFTPGSTAGSPLSLLQSFDPPSTGDSSNPFDREDAESLREQIAGLVSALLGLIRRGENQTQSLAHSFLATVLEQRWRAGQKTDLVTLIRLIQSPPINQLGALPLDTVFPAREREKLALELNGLLASPSFQTWLEGEPLQISSLLRAPDGRPRLSVCYLAHLNDEERMFFVSLLLNSLIGWMRGQPGSSDLRALLYFDEIFGYLPPHPASPPSKNLLLTLLKQGRAFGLGTMVVTQNPVDLDYKALSNCGTWLIGRLQTEQDKARILDGLQGAMNQAGKPADRRSLDLLLSGLGKRVFLLHNIHSGEPKVFQSRWAMSYLAGPLTRVQLRQLVDREKVDTTAGKPENPTPATLADFLGGEEAASLAAEGLCDIAPPIPAGLNLRFSPTAESPLTAWIFARAEILFADARSGSALKTEWLLKLGPEVDPLDWDHSIVLPPSSQFPSEVPAGARFHPLPATCQDLATLKKLGGSLANHLVSIAGLEIFVCPPVKEKSQPGESKDDFMGRIRQLADGKEATTREQLEKAAGRKREPLENRLRRELLTVTKAEEVLAQCRRDESVSTFSNLAEGVFSILGGRRATGARKLGSTLRGASTKRARTKRAELDLEKAVSARSAAETALQDLQTQLAADLAALAGETDSLLSQIETTKLLPTKSGIRIQEFGILWLPVEKAGQPPA